MNAVVYLLSIQFLDSLADKNKMPIQYLFFPDYQEASDGNMHVKVHLCCPNCRSDLSVTIRDTLLLRKADAVRRLTRKPETKQKLTDSQKLLLKVIDTKPIQEAIEKARREENQYLGKESKRLSMFKSFRSSIHNSRRETSVNEEESVEEWGFEVDINVGAHESFRCPKEPSKRKSAWRNNSLPSDPSLFSGLDFCMNEEQRRHITDLMTSADPDKLCEASHDLYDLLHDSNTGSRVTRGKRKLLDRRSSVYNLIEESKAIHMKEEKKEEVAMGIPAVSRQAQVAAQYDQLQRQAIYQRKYPLPVRMPKTIMLDELEESRLDMTFLDYKWDGTVMDAYSKITIGLLGTVSQKDTENQGVRRILGKGNGKLQVELPGTPRVLILNAGLAGRKGAHRGDVVTHIDGISVMNKNAKEIREILEAKASMGDFALLTLNAEKSVSEALRRRAMAISDDM